VKYFFFCRDKPGTASLREQLAEAHWTFMDGYAGRMIARGPTLADDGVTATGSMHIVDLPDADAARIFAFEEPNYKAGVYAEVMVRRWRNTLGRTMWEFAGDPQDGVRFLVIGHGKPGSSRTPDRLWEAYGDRLIVSGALLSDDGLAWVGDALAVELPSRRAVEELVTSEPSVQAGLYERIEIHLWRFGGRPAA
jgi:uncharacterized protein YciI